MKHKWLIAGTGFALGAIMLAAGGLSAMANTSGYEAYKSALLHTKAQANLTVQASFAVTDNGANVLTGEAKAKWNEAAESASVDASLTDGTQSRAVNVYRQDDKVIVKTDDSDVYRVAEAPKPKWADRDSKSGDAQAGSNTGAPSQPPQAVLQLFDMLAGHMKELATVENTADGGKHAELHLTGSQIPAIVNAIGSLAASGAGHHGFGPHGIAAADAADNGAQPNALNCNLPQLTDDVRVASVKLDADIGADNVLEHQTARIVVTGTDADGLPHELALRLDLDFSDVNRTVPERIDLTGKTTEAIDRGQEDGEARGWGWHR